jgi:hypothetical protein
MLLSVHVITNAQENNNLEISENAQKLLLQINDTYEKLGSYLSYHNEDLYEERLYQLDLLLKEYLALNESLSFDISTFAPFILSAHSDDGLVHIYCFDMRTGGTFNSYYSIIQYVKPDRTLGLINFAELYGIESLLLADDLQYTKIDKLDDNIYIFSGWGNVGGMIEGFPFFTIEIKDDVKPYPAFMDKTMFTFLRRHIIDLSLNKTYLTDISTNFLQKPYTIQLEYDTYTDETTFNSETETMNFTDGKFNGNYDVLLH